MFQHHQQMKHASMCALTFSFNHLPMKCTSLLVIKAISFEFSTTHANNEKTNRLAVQLNLCVSYFVQSDCYRNEILAGYFHLDTVIVMSNTTLIDCKFHIEKIDSQLKSILRLTPRSTNSIEPNGTHSQGFSHNRRPFYDDDQPDPLMMRKLIISLSILAFFTSLLCTGLCAYYINRRLHLRRIRKKRKKAGIFSIRQSLEQFPVIVFMARDQKQNFPNEICPRCSICFEPLCDHTRVRKLSKRNFFFSSSHNSISIDLL